MRTLLALALACALPVAAAEMTLLELPKVWEGKKADTAEGNPAAAKGMPPMWRLDRLWPSKTAEDGKAYRPLKWNGDRRHWYDNENAHGGYPSARLVDNHTISFGVCSAWPGQEGHKIPVLVFIAPTGATYGFSATVTVDRSQGQGEFTLGIYRRETNKTTLRTVEVKKVPLSLDKPTKIEVIEELQTGQELCIMARASLDNTSATVRLADITMAARR